MKKPDGSAGPTDGTVDQPATNADPSAQQSRWQPMTIKVKGQDFVVDNQEKAVELLQKGAAYETSNESLREERRKLREEHAEVMKRLEPLLAVDEELRTDPVKRAKVNAALRGEPLPPDPTFDPEDLVGSEIRAIKGQIASLAATIDKRLGSVSSSVEDVRRSERFRAEERSIRNRYGKWATDDAIDQAREFADRHGVDLTTAFKAVTYDDVPDRVRQATFEEFDIDPAQHTPARSEVPTLEGFGPATPEALQRIYADPDLYQRWKPQLREMRRRSTGKVPLPR